MWSYEAHTTDQTGGFAESVVSEKGILIDVESVLEYSCRASAVLWLEEAAYLRLSGRLRCCVRL